MDNPIERGLAAGLATNIARYNRRDFVRGTMLLALSSGSSVAQGFAGLGGGVEGFAALVPGTVLTFPADHGPHPEYRIEWWYVTANLQDSAGTPYGAQWTLFRQAMTPGPQKTGWANQQIWMGHAAVTRADLHRYSERFARGGIGVSDVEAKPFHAWIDAWDMHGLDQMSATTIAPIEFSASGENFGYELRLDAERPLVLQGDAGYMRNSDRGEEASYYFSQPFFKATGLIMLDEKPVSQKLASDESGWDWFALHLNSGDKVMLYRFRHSDGQKYFAGNWIDVEARSHSLAHGSVLITPTVQTKVSGRELPTEWSIEIPERKLKIKCVSLNPQSWMGTSIPYWEGPIRFHGSHDGVGYLEMTGY